MTGAPARVSVGHVDRRQMTFDVALATAVTVLMQYEVFFIRGTDQVYAHRPLSSPIMLLVTASLAWRRRAPLATASAVGLGLALQVVVSGTYSGSIAVALTLLIATYSIGAYGSTTR